MGVALGPLVWALIAGYWLWWRPRLVAAGRWPAGGAGPGSLVTGFEILASLALAALGGWLAADSFATPVG